MKIGIYAGSIRPGGGLTVLIQVIKALAEDKENELIIYVGEDDTSRFLHSLLEGLDNVHEKRFMARYGSSLRYLFSKFYFLYESIGKKFDWIFSFNYHLFSRSPVAVYHINLLSFQQPSIDSLVMKVKRFDARQACRKADLNIFESLYLQKVAQERLNGKIQNPGLLYISVDKDFVSESLNELTEAEAFATRSNLMLVSSIQPHKDNETCLRCLKILCERYPEVPWVLRVAGGQSIAQWQGFERLAEEVGISESLEILGPIDKKALASYMHRSLCLVNASRIESFCMVAVEAMASSCPVIVVDSTSMPESVGDSAIIVEPSSATMFADAIVEFYDNETFRQDYIARGLERAAGMKENVFITSLREYFKKSL